MNIAIAVAGNSGVSSVLTLILAKLDKLGNFEARLSSFIDQQVKTNSEVSAAIAEIPRITQKLLDHETELDKLKEQVTSLSLHPVLPL